MQNRVIEKPIFFLIYELQLYSWIDQMLKWTDTLTRRYRIFKNIILNEPKYDHESDLHTSVFDDCGTVGTLTTSAVERHQKSLLDPWPSFDSGIFTIYRKNNFCQLKLGQNNIFLQNFFESCQPKKWPQYLQFSMIIITILAAFFMSGWSFQKVFQKFNLKKNITISVQLSTLQYYY